MPSRLVDDIAARLPSPIYRVARRVRIRRTVAAYPERLVTRQYGHGVPLTLSIQDPLAEAWYEKEAAHDYPEFRAARGLGMNLGATVFDLGAHQAVVALVLADIVGPSGRVVAVEADRHNTRVARRNLHLNGSPNVVVVDAACTDQSGTAFFYEGLNGYIAGGRLGAHRVRSVTIDELAHEYGHPAVVVIDIEGHEAAALRGAERTLRLGSTFVIEVHAGGELQATGASVPQLAGNLVVHGYDLQLITEADWWAEAPPRPAQASELPSDERFFMIAARASDHRADPVA
jgi:FkbM family methyltransferase